MVDVAVFAEFDVPRGLRLLNTSDLCFPHDCHPNPVHDVSKSQAGGGPVPAGYVRLRVTRATGQAQWSWLNQAIKIQVQITDPSLYGCTFPLARVRVYSNNADRLRSDNWQKLSLSIVELKPIQRLPRRLRTDFGWDYLREFPTDAASGLSAVQMWRNLGFNTIPALVSAVTRGFHAVICDLWLTGKHHDFVGRIRRRS
jgi:hypothetical protein